MAPVTLTSSSYYYQDCRILAHLARLLGSSADAVTYDALAEQIREAINAQFLDGATGCYATGSQTEQGCALYFDLPPAALREKVVARLVQAVAEKDGHVDFGILGSKYVLNALAENGEAAVAYTMATQRTFPGWGYWLAQGATTLWEDWHGAFSRNHIMFGDISAWMFKTLAGIAPDPTAPGFQRFLIRPQPVGDLTWVCAKHETMYGLIHCAWEVTATHFSLHLLIPPNCQARVFLPPGVSTSVTEGGVPIAQAVGVEWVGDGEKTRELRVDAGEYRLIMACQ